jgi:hypothetical protein
MNTDIFRIKAWCLIPHDKIKYIHPTKQGMPYRPQDGCPVCVGYNHCQNRAIEIPNHRRNHCARVSSVSAAFHSSPPCYPFLPSYGKKEKGRTIENGWDVRRLVLV